MNITAKIIEISATQQITESFRKRDLVVEHAENPEYPEFVKFEVIQDKCEMLDSLKAGQSVEVHFNLKGRKWTNPQGEVKYFNSLQAWRIVPAEVTQAKPDAANSQEEDELPF